jgi:hypothetical protein
LSYVTSGDANGFPGRAGLVTPSRVDPSPQRV